MRFKDKVAIVTGGAGEIGKATVRQLAGEGARVLIADVAQDGPRLAQEMLAQGLQVAYCKVVVSKEDQVIAKAIAFLASDDAAFITGHSLVVDGGYTAL